MEDALSSTVSGGIGRRILLKHFQDVSLGISKTSTCQMLRLKNFSSTVSEGGGAINKFHLGTVAGSRVKLHSGKRLAQLCRLQLTGG